MKRVKLHHEVFIGDKLSVRKAFYCLGGKTKTYQYRFVDSYNPEGGVVFLKRKRDGKYVNITPIIPLSVLYNIQKIAMCAGSKDCTDDWKSIMVGKLLSLKNQEDIDLIKVMEVIGRQ